MESWRWFSEYLICKNIYLKLEKYKKNYPNVKNHVRKSVQKIYGLNKARKSMREALGFTLDDNLQEVLFTYATLSKLFEKGEKITLKLDREKKNIYKSHKKLTQHISKIKSFFRCFMYFRVYFDTNLSKNI